MKNGDNKKKVTRYTLYKDEQVINSQTYYRGSVVSAVFRQTDVNTLTVLLDERLDPSHFLKVYLSCVLLGLLPFLLAYIGSAIPLYGLLIAFVILSVLIIMFRYYKTRFVYHYVFDKQERSFVRSRLHIKPTGMNIEEFINKDLSGIITPLNKGIVSQIISYKGNIGTESPFSIFLSDVKGNRTTFINTSCKEQVIGYSKVLSEFLQIPTSFVKYRQNAIDWRQERI